MRALARAFGAGAIEVRAFGVGASRALAGEEGACFRLQGGAAGRSVSALAGGRSVEHVSGSARGAAGTLGVGIR